MHNDQPAPATPNSASTGPRTQAGKAISSQNARKHDLCSRTLRLSPEEWAEYNEMSDRYRRDLQPGGDVEESLIDEICFNYWRLQQSREVELDMMAKHPFDLPLISLYIRYRTGYERAFYKALDQLQKLQRDRRKQAAQSGVQAANLCAEVRSAETVALEIQEFTKEFDDHILANRVRSERHLDSLPLPEQLADRLDRFVSKNPDALPPQLLEILKKVA